MTFDEAIEHFKNNTDISGIAVFLDDVEDTLKEMRDEYAPTVEMTKRHRDNLIDMKNEGYSFFETIADIDSGVLIREFDSYWNPLTVDELMQAWLHPDTIKVVGED